MQRSTDESTTCDDAATRTARAARAARAATRVAALYAASVAAVERGTVRPASHVVQTPHCEEPAQAVQQRPRPLVLR